MKEGGGVQINLSILRRVGWYRKLFAIDKLDLMMASGIMLDILIFEGFVIVLQVPGAIVVTTYS